MVGHHQKVLGKLLDKLLLFCERPMNVAEVDLVDDLVAVVEETVVDVGLVEEEVEEETEDVDLLEEDSVGEVDHQDHPVDLMEFLANMVLDNSLVYCPRTNLQLPGT
ncbi:MAG: hypothetical protein SGILL_010035 [Bacillariaceae sp.]